MSRRQDRNPEARKRIAAWRRARIDHYVRTRNIETLAEMLIDLEDEMGAPEFGIDEEWPK